MRKFCGLGIAIFDKAGDNGSNAYIYVDNQDLSYLRGRIPKKGACLGTDEA